MNPTEALGTLCAVLALFGALYGRGNVKRVRLFYNYFTGKMVVLMVYLAMDVTAWTGHLTMTDFFFDLRRLILMAGLAYIIWRFNWSLRQVPPDASPPPREIPLK